MGFLLGFSKATRRITRQPEQSTAPEPELGYPEPWAWPQEAYSCLASS